MYAAAPGAGPFSGNGMTKRVPVVDLSRCTDCESCLVLCPSVFKRNEETGRIEIVDRSEYPEEEIREVIAMCPADCISWEET